MPNKYQWVHYTDKLYVTTPQIENHWNAEGAEILELYRLMVMNRLQAKMPRQQLEMEDTNMRVSFINVI